jgi:threonine dehydrogenase-like Zn-dependent dehydrogenase
MKGVVLLGDQKLEVREFPMPEPGPGEVLVKMQASGICGSDLHTIYEAPSGRPWNNTIAGHEPCGVIDKLGEGVRGFDVGDRVMVMWVGGCGNCPACYAGDLDHCQKDRAFYGWGHNGGFSDYMVARAISLVPMPEGISFATGAYLTCAGTTAYRATKRLSPSGVDRLVAFGLGPVGLAGVIWAKLYGAQVIGVDTLPERLDLARQIGADHVIDFKQTEPVAAIMDLTHGRGADIALDYSGAPKGRVDALNAVRVEGRVGFVGEGGDTTINISRTLIWKSLNVIGSRIFDKPTLAEAARLVAERNLPFDDLVTGRYGSEQAQEAFELFRAGHTGKLIFEWGGQ